MSFKKVGRIYIQDKPFEGILRSAYECLNVECMGFLFGKSIADKNFVIQQVHPIQLARRTACSSQPLSGVRAGWSFMHDYLGSMHSHVPSRCQIDKVQDYIRAYADISPSDKADFLEDENSIELILALNFVRVRRKLINSPYKIAGYIKPENRTYRFELIGYYKDPRIRRAQLEISDRARSFIS